MISQKIFFVTEEKLEEKRQLILKTEYKKLKDTNLTSSNNN